MSRTRLDERLYGIYADFFARAERERRWRVDEDVPWESVNPGASDDLALCAETFCAVEAYLPDYVARGINIVRDSFGQGWWQANWAYEESKHAYALGEWLVRSGKRTRAQMLDFYQGIFANTWTPLFPTARQMTCYGVIQEMATFVIYCKHRAYAEREGDACLRKIYDFVARDEIAHTRFYQTVVRALMEEDREGTLADLGNVLAHFEMPGVTLVPDYDSRILRMRAAGVDRNVFVQKVFVPVLKQLGVDRHDVRRAYRAQRAGAGAETGAAHRVGSRP